MPKSAKKRKPSNSPRKIRVGDDKLVALLVNHNLSNLRKRLKRQSKKVKFLNSENINRINEIQSAETINLHNYAKIRLLVENTKSLKEVVSLMEVLSTPPPILPVKKRSRKNEIQAICPPPIFNKSGEINEVDKLLYKKLIAKIANVFEDRHNLSEKSEENSTKKNKKTKKENKENSEEKLPKINKNELKNENKPTNLNENELENINTEKLELSKNRGKNEKNPFADSCLPSQRKSENKSGQIKEALKATQILKKQSKLKTKFKAAVHVICLALNFEKTVGLLLLIRYNNILNLVNQKPHHVENLIKNEMSAIFTFVFKEKVFEKYNKNPNEKLIEADFKEAVELIMKAFISLRDRLSKQAYRKPVLYFIHTNLSGGLLLPRKLSDFELRRESYSRRRFFQFSPKRKLEDLMKVVFAFFVRVFMKEILGKELADNQLASFAGIVVYHWLVRYFDQNLPVHQNSFLKDDSAGESVFEWGVDRKADVQKQGVKFNAWGSGELSDFVRYDQKDAPIANLEVTDEHRRFLRSKKINRFLNEQVLTGFEKLRVFFVRLFYDSKVSYLVKKKAETERICGNNIDKVLREKTMLVLDGKIRNCLKLKDREN